MRNINTFKFDFVKYIVYIFIDVTFQYLIYGEATNNPNYVLGLSFGADKN